MKGNNTLSLNEATMIAAVQHYFATIVFRDNACPKVTSVKASSSRSAYSESFDIELSDPEPPAAA